MVTNLSAPTLVLSPDKVKEIFPFHVAFGADWQIRQCGRSLSRICLQVRPGNRFPDVFTPTRPETPFDYQTIWNSKPDSFLQGPNTDPLTVQYIRMQLSLGQGFSAELVNYSKSGREYWLAIEVQPIYDLNGQITNFMAVETDITAREDSESRLAMQFQVTKALAETGDLQEVLPKILEAICRHLDGYSGVAWRADPNSHRLIHIEHWVSPSQSNLAARLHPPAELPLDDKSVAASIVCNSKLPRWERVNLVGDPIRLRQVLLNLVGNGVKFTDRGEVRTHVKLIHLTDSEIRIRLEVQDTGIGLDGDQIGRLFLPFVQADGSAARRFTGSGLGLAICRRLIDLMHGEIGVHSQVGIGSTFWFELPTKRATWVEEPKPKSKHFKPIWIVSTDLSLFESLEEHLKGHELTACRIPTAEALLQQLASHSEECSLPLIVLVDEPVWQADQALVQGALQSRQSQFPSVLLARPATAVAMAKPLEASFSIVLTKPVKHNQLDQVLHKSSDSSDQKIATNTCPIPQNSMATKPPGRSAN